MAIKTDVMTITLPPFILTCGAMGHTRAMRRLSGEDQTSSGLNTATKVRQVNDSSGLFVEPAQMIGKRNRLAFERESDIFPHRAQAQRRYSPAGPRGGGGGRRSPVGRRREHKRI